MQLKTRIEALEKVHQQKIEADEHTLFWWRLGCEDNPEALGPPPADWIAFFNGKTIDDLILELD